MPLAELYTPQQVDRDRRQEKRMTHYPETERVKTSLFAEVSHAGQVTDQLDRSTRESLMRYHHPLVQVRAIVPLQEQEELVSSVKNLSWGDKVTANVAGRVPFQINDAAYGLYWIQAEHENRKAFKASKSLSHTEAVINGISRRGKRRPTPEGFQVKTLAVEGDTVYSLCGNENIPINIDPINLAEKLVYVHRAAFETPHDTAQQDPQQVLDIISANPVIVAVSEETGAIASVGLWEEDPNFTFEGIRLVEPTFFTDPEFEGKGLSSSIRQASQQLVEEGTQASPILLFQESIRYTSFPLALANGYELGGDSNNIKGDLGEAYTIIGSASGGEKGMMPMGLTYAIDRRIRLQ